MERLDPNTFDGEAAPIRARRGQWAPPKSLRINVRCAIKREAWNLPRGTSWLYLVPEGGELQALKPRGHRGFVHPGGLDDGANIERVFRRAAFAVKL